MKKMSLLLGIIAFLLIFNACTKEEVQISEETPSGFSTAIMDTLTLSVAAIQESDENPEVFNLIFNESAAIYHIAKNASAAINALQEAKERDIPVVVRVSEKEIQEVRMAGKEQVAAYRQAAENALDTLSLQEILSQGNQKNGRTVIPDMRTLNRIFDALKDMSVATTSGRVIGYNLNYPGYYLGRVPFQYAHDGCFARAHAMRYVIENNFGYQSWKRFIVASNSNIPLTVKATKWGNRGCCIVWSFHVAPVVQVRTSSNRVEVHVLDPSLFDRPVPVATWDNSMIGNRSTVCQNNSRYNRYYQRVYTASAAYNFSKRTNGQLSFIPDNNYQLTYSTMNDYRYLASCY